MTGFMGRKHFKISIETNDNRAIGDIADDKKNKEKKEIPPALSDKTWKESHFSNTYTHEHNGVFHFIYDSNQFAEYMVRLHLFSIE